LETAALGASSQGLRPGLVRLRAHLIGEVKVLSSFIQRQTVTGLQLRRRETRWGAAGGKRPVRRMTNSIRPA